MRRTAASIPQRVCAVALALALGSASAWAAGTDLNGDSKVDALDAQAFLEGVAQGTPPPGLDLDGDGKVGLSDALLFGRWIDGLYQQPAAGLPTLYFSNPADTAAFAGYQADKQAKSAWTLADLKQLQRDLAKAIG